MAPLHPAAKQAYLAALSDGWADPRRLHTEGRRSQLLLDGAREAVADALRMRPEAVAFTGSFVSAAHAGVLGTLAGRRRSGELFVHSAVEHSAILAAGDAHARAGGRTVSVAVDTHGVVDAEACAGQVGTDGVAAVAVQFANGEVGTLQPAQEVGEACRRAGVPLVMDVSPALGQVELPDVGDVLLADPQAWGSVPGLGILAVRPGTRWRSVQPEDDAVRGDRPGVPGSVNVPAALAAAVSLQQTLADRDRAWQSRYERIARLRDQLPTLVPDVETVGHPVRRLPHILTFSALYVDGEALLLELDRAGFAVGSGSACTSATLEPSHVLAAMNVLTQGNVRIGLPATTQEAELQAQTERFLDVVGPAVQRVRAQLGTLDL